MRMVTGQMNRLLKSVAADDFWRQFYREELNQPNADERVKQQFSLMAGLLRFFRSNPILARLSWIQSTPVQIIASEDDRWFTKHETGFLGSLFPRSQKYIEVVQRFIAGVNRSLQV